MKSKQGDSSSIKQSDLDLETISREFVEIEDIIIHDMMTFFIH